MTAVQSDRWPTTRQSDARRFSPVTEADLQRDFDDARDAIPGRRWPEDWQGYRLHIAERDMAILRRTRWETQQ